MTNYLKLFKLLFLNIQGAQPDGDVDRVLAGLDAKISQGTTEIGWATNVSFDEDFELQNIRTLGFHGDRGYKSQGYNCTVTVGTFVLSGLNVKGKLVTPNRDNILTDGSITFTVTDSEGNTLYRLTGCRCATKGVTIDNGSLSQRNTTWRCVKVVEENVS